MFDREEVVEVDNWVVELMRKFGFGVMVGYM